MEIHKFKSLVDSMAGLFSESSSSMSSFGNGINRTVHDELIESILEWYRKDVSDKQRHVEDGHLFNLFDLWSRYSVIGETVHSKLIHFLLYPDALHGQNRRYLEIFLEMLNISHPSEGMWTITAEKGRVDVRLIRNDPRSVILIENKSNWAGDQSNQLYRYWYQNIHRCTEDCSTDYYKDKDYRIIYLVPKKEKTISESSLSKPPKDWFVQGHEYDELPGFVPLAPIVWTFDNEFSQWIELCIKATPEGNFPLRSYLSQYLNYCKRL